MKYQNTTTLAKWLTRGTAAAALLAVGTLSAATQGYWRFQGNSFRDNTVGSSNDLTGTGSPTQTTLPGSGAGSAFPDPVPQNGFANDDAVSFNGSNYFESGDVNGQNFTSDVTLTFEVFFNANSISSGTTNAFGGIWGNGSTGDRTFLLGIRDGGTLGTTLRGSNSSGAQEQSGVNFGSLPSIATGTDYYAALVVDGSDSVTGYLQDLSNGGSLQSVTGSTNEITSFNNTSEALTIASLAGGSNFDGLIDEVRVSTSALSQSELLVSVPEPSTYALLGGLLALGFAVVRRRVRS